MSGFRGFQGFQSETCIAMLDIGVSSGCNCAEEAALVLSVCGSLQTARFANMAQYTLVCQGCMWRLSPGALQVWGQGALLLQ